MRKLRMHIAQMVSPCDYLNVRSRESVTGGQSIALPVMKIAETMARKCRQPLTSVYRLCRQRQWQEVFSWLVILLSLWVPGYAQDTPSDSESVPVIASPPPSSQERLLSPVPTQFDWIQRQVRPNPLLEALLTLRGSPSQLFLSATLSEEYTDNFSEEGSGGDGREEYRTTLSIGTVYRLESGQSFVSLANSLSANYQARAGDWDIGFANLSLNMGYQMSRLSLALSESFIRDDDTGQTADTDLNQGHQTFLQNRISPQMRYVFSRLTSMALAYANTIVMSAGGDDADDSLSHTVNTSLQHRFSRAFTGNVDYTFNTNNSDGGADTESQEGTVDFGYLIDRRTSLIFQLFGLITNRSHGGTDSVSYGTSFGIRRQLTSFLSAFASIGTTVFDQQGRDPRAYPTWQVALDGALGISRRTSLTLTSQQSIEDTADEVDSVGIVQRLGVTLSLNHTFTQALLGTMFVSFTRTDQLEGNVGTSESMPGRDDNFWRVGARASYALSRVVSLSLVYLYQNRASTDAGADFDENRLTFSISSVLPVF